MEKYGRRRKITKKRGEKVVENGETRNLSRIIKSLVARS